MAGTSTCNQGELRDRQSRSEQISVNFKIQDSKTLFVTYTYRICSEIKIGDAQLNVQKNTIDNMNWRDPHKNIYNIYNKKDQQE